MASSQRASIDRWTNYDDGASPDAERAPQRKPKAPAHGNGGMKMMRPTRERYS